MYLAASGHSAAYRRTTKLRVAIACQCSVGACGRCDIVLSSQSSRKCRYRLSAYPCDPSDHLQESPGPLGPKSQKSLEESLLGGSAKKAPKIPEKFEKYPKNTQICTFPGIFRLFRVFSGTFWQTRQKDTFRFFGGISGPEGPETPVNGRLPPCLPSVQKLLHYSTLFRTIHLGCRNVNYYIVEIVLELFLGAVILIEHSNDIHTVVSHDSGLWENEKLWRRNVVFTSQKWKTN